MLFYPDEDVDGCALAGRFFLGGINNNAAVESGDDVLGFAHCCSYLLCVWFFLAKNNLP